MRILCCFLFSTLLALVPALAAAGQTYRLDLSPDLYGKVVLRTPGDTFSPGTVTVHRKSDNKTLVRVQAAQLSLELHDGKALPNIVQLPYGEQSVILYQDVNFDGVKDLAIMDGQNSCYNGPSFQVYLAAKSDQLTFTPAPAFTRLAQEYCGMFEVDNAEKVLRTMTKSGCCWHQMSTFKVVDGVPQAVRVVEEALSGTVLMTVTESTWDGRKMVTRTRSELDLSNGVYDELFSFDVEGRDAKVLLLNPCCDLLVYALVRKDGHAEFVYPAGDYPNGKYPKDEVFRVQADGTTDALAFGTRAAQYTLYHDAQAGTAGIRVVQGQRTVEWKAKPGSVKGSLRFENTFKNLRR